MKLGISLDGGGIRGVVTAMILKNIEKDIKAQIHEVADCIFGTSTGGIIAVMLGAGIPARDILEVYKKQGARIFQRNKFNFMLGGYFGPKYSSDGLRDVAKEVMGDTKLGQLKVPTVLTSYSLEEGAPKFWKSTSECDKDYSCADIAIATSAAPTYFKPHIITHMNGDKTGYIDGGIVANSPAACCGAELINMFPDEELRCLSIGCGTTPGTIASGTALGWGIIEWGKRIAPVLMDGSSDAEDHIMKTVLGSRYLRINKFMPGWVSAEIDCVTKINIDSLGKLGDIIYFENREKILAIFS